MSALEVLEEVRRRIPATVGATAGIIADNPAQFAVIASGSYVVTRGLGRLVRPYTIGGALMVGVASYAACSWLLAEAQRRGVLEFKVRDPVTGELVTTAELAELEREAAKAFTETCCAAPPLIDLDALEREVKRRAAPPG